MTMYSRVLVLCNGVPRPEEVGEYKNVLTLAYNPNARSERNIQLSLPDFVQDVYHLPARLLDLLEIAAYVFSADRLIRRGERDDATSLFDREDFHFESQPKTSVLLFSGGLDSLAGAIERLENSNDQVYLVSHRSQPGVMRT